MHVVYDKTIINKMDYEINRAHTSGKRIIKFLLTEDEWEEVKLLNSREQIPELKRVEGSSPTYMGITLEKDMAQYNSQSSEKSWFRKRGTGTIES